MEMLLLCGRGEALAAAIKVSGKVLGSHQFQQLVGIARTIVFNRTILFVRALALR